MSFKSYVTLMILTTLACFLALMAVIYFFDPQAGGTLVLVFFYASLFLTLVGIFSLLGLIIRVIFTSSQLIFKKVVSSFRQSIWFSSLIVVSLLLQTNNLFNWKNLLFLILAIAFLEMFFISYKSRPSAKI